MKLKALWHRLGKYKHYILSFLIQIALAGFFIHEWDGFVFIASAEQFLQGITPYEVASAAPAYTFSGWMQLWYAYPPLPLLLFSSTCAPYFYLMGDNLILARIFLKLSFILGNLLCAYLVYRFVAGVSSQERASKAEKLVLYNPFLIFISAVWGMFDIWMVNFLLLSLLNLRQDRFGRAGVFFGLSVLIKPIPVILAPIFLAHIWNKKRDLFKPTLFASSAVATFCLISLPFFLSSYQGFMSQVLGMHAGRPPFGLAPLYGLYLGQLLSTVRNISFFSLSSGAISAISMALLGTVIFIFFLYYCLKKEREERGLLASLFLLMLAFTLFSKGVSPQHLVVPLAFAIILLYTYNDYILIKVKDLGRYYKFLVLPYLGAALLEGRHYLTFIPPDIALRLMGKTAFELDSQIARSFPISADFYYVIPQVVYGLLIAPAIIMAGIILYKSLRRVVPYISEVVSLHLTRIRLVPEIRLIKTSIIVFLASLFVITPTLAAVGASQYEAEIGPPLRWATGYSAGEKQTPSEEEDIVLPPSYDREDRLVGVLYYYCWNNSSRDPSKRYENWLYSRLTPEEGYYMSGYAYMKEDIQQMKQVGIDFALLNSYHYNFERYIAFAWASEEEGFYFAPLIDLEDHKSDSTYLATTPQGEPDTEGGKLALNSQTKAEIIDFIDEALWMKDASSFLRYEEKPLVFLDDSNCFAPGWSDEEKECLARSLVESYQEDGCTLEDAVGKISLRWGIEVNSIEDLKQYYPEDVDSFIEPESQVERDWAQAYLRAWKRFWEDIKKEIEAKHGKVFWVGQDCVPSEFFTEKAGEAYFQTFDGWFISSPAQIWYSAWLDSQEEREMDENLETFLSQWEKEMELLHNYSQEYIMPTIISVTPYFDDTLVRPENEGFGIPLKIGGEYSYDLFWGIALQNAPNIVLIASWNQYYESSCIEPTVEFGELFLKKTEYWSSVFKEGTTGI